MSEVRARIRMGASAGIHLPVIRIAGQVGRKLAAGSVDGGLHVASRGIDVAVEIKLQNDAG